MIPLVPFSQRLEIYRLKKVAIRHLSEFLRLTGDLDCGNALAAHISPEAAKHKQKYEEAVAQLRTLDPNFPKE